MDRPALISVVIPARNAEATLAETLESLLRQSVDDWEAFIVDDGSTDATAAIIGAYAARDSRFHGMQGPGKGVSFARNLGIAAAQGKWLHFLDADDWTEPEFFQKLLAALAANPNAVAAFCGFRRMMTGGLITPVHRIPDTPEDPFEEFARGCLVAIHTVLVEREIIVRLGGFDTSLTNCEDWDLWQRLSRLGRQWVLVNEALAYYRTDRPSLSRKVAWLLSHSRKIIARGFGPDERLAGIAQKHASGACPSRGGIEQALAFNALWTLGMDCGAGGPGTVDSGMLQPYTAAATEAQVIASVIFEGLLVGSRSLADQLAARWPSYGEKLTGLITWLGELWNDAQAARAIQYHLEERILYSEAFSVPRRLSLTQSVQVDIANPPDTKLAPGIDRLYVCFTEGGKPRAQVIAAALGNFTKPQWLRVRGVKTNLPFRHWRKAHGLAAYSAVLRHAPKSLTEPGMLRREKRRAAASRAMQRARLSLLGPLDPPGSHAAAMREVKIWAADHAKADGAAGMRARRREAFTEKNYRPAPCKTAAPDERRAVPVLMYHGIVETGPAGLARFRVSPAMFEAQLRWLRANGFYSIGSAQLAAHMASGAAFHGRPVMLTFDDGFQDFADNAWPLLQAQDFTAEMFVVTDLVGQSAIWDAKFGPPAKLMDAATIARLAAEGALFGSHLATHRPVDGLSSLELARELAGSHAMLESWLGKPPVSFAAPFTITDNRLGWVAAQTGYAIGFGGGKGVARLDMDPLNLPRIVAEGGWTLDDFIDCMESCL